MSDSHGQIEDCVFSVVGHHAEDPGLLLLRGEDGRYYEINLDDGVPNVVELSANWLLDLDLDLAS